jgi:hypothetical protein
MMMQTIVWAEESGAELRVTPHAGVLEISILKNGAVVATVTVARYRWNRVVQSVRPPPPADIIYPLPETF